MVDPTSLSLLERLRSLSDEPSWRSFTEIYGPFIDRILRRAGLNETDVEELRQDVMTVVVREIPNFRHNRRVGAFRTWLRITTSNRIRSFRRLVSQRKQFESVADQLEDPQSDLTALWEKEYASHVVRGLLKQLATEFKPDTLAMFRRAALENASIADVADEFSRSRNAVIVARSKVLRRLRELGEGLLE